MNIDYKVLIIAVLLTIIIFIGLNLSKNNTCECACKTNMIECNPEIKTIEVVKLIEKDCNCYKEALTDVKETNEFLKNIKEVK